MRDKTCKWVALLRGVNVGGANKVAMAELRALADGLGWCDVKTYIASGNLVFQAEAQTEPQDLAALLRAAMGEALGVDVPVAVLRGADIIQAHAACPWEAKGNLVHVFFCFDTPQVDGALRDALIADDEDMVVQGRRVWLHAPSGVARSKLLAKMDAVLGVQATARNLNTLRKLADMAAP